MTLTIQWTSDRVVHAVEMLVRLFPSLYTLTKQKHASGNTERSPETRHKSSLRWPEANFHYAGLNDVVEVGAVGWNANG
jgi:hypothetical protein